MKVKIWTYTSDNRATRSLIQYVHKSFLLNTILNQLRENLFLLDKEIITFALYLIMALELGTSPLPKNFKALSSNPDKTMVVI
jgi:hypothetical protein